MPGIYIVPDALRDTINKRLDEEIAKCPDAEKDREFLYGELLDAFNKYGQIPDFTLVKTDATLGDEHATPSNSVP